MHLEPMARLMSRDFALTQTDTRTFVPSNMPGVPGVHTCPTVMADELLCTVWCT